MPPAPLSPGIPCRPGGPWDPAAPAGPIAPWIRIIRRSLVSLNLSCLLLFNEPEDGHASPLFTLYFVSYQYKFDNHRYRFVPTVFYKYCEKPLNQEYRFMFNMTIKK